MARPTKIAAVFLVLCSAGSIVAQNTWNGLRFGMSQDQAKQLLAKQGFELHQRADEEAYTLTPDFSLRIQGLPAACSFGPLLFFDSGKLWNISLTLNIDKMRADTKLGSVELLQLLAEKVFNELVVKYGSPTSQTGPCEQVSTMSTSAIVEAKPFLRCKAKWRGDAQLITLGWSYYTGAGSLMFYVEYLAASGGF